MNYSQILQFRILLARFPSYYSLCNTTIKPIIPSITCFSHGCSLKRIVTYPTKGMNPATLPITSSLRLRNDCPRAYSSVSSAKLLSPLVSRRRGDALSRYYYTAVFEYLMRCSLESRMYLPPTKSTHHSVYNRDILSFHIIHNNLANLSILAPVPQEK